MSAPLHSYRICGTATYIDRAGQARRRSVDRVTEAPDAGTAKILALADIDIDVGANRSYDPQSRWTTDPKATEEATS